MLPPRPPKSVNGLRANKKNNLISNRMIKLTEKLSTNQSSDSQKYISKSKKESIPSIRPFSASSIRSSAQSRKRSLSSSRNKSISKQSTKQEINIIKAIPPTITSKCWGLFEIRNKKKIAGNYMQRRRQMASLTKMMNFVTILQITEQLGINPSSLYLPVNERASKMIGTTARLQHGDILSLSDLFYGMMLPSGNDAAYQTAIIGGAILKEKDQIANFSTDRLLQKMKREKQCVQRYLAEMNRRAKILNMFKSKWSNPHGLSNRQNFTTVNDLFLLCSYAMKKCKFREVVSTKQYTCVVQNFLRDEIQSNQGDFVSLKRTLTWQNTNKMLWKGWSGIKTGITPNAGPCLAASVQINLEGKQLEFLVILGGCKSMQQRWVEVQKLVQWAIQHNLY